MSNVAASSSCAAFARHAGVLGLRRHGRGQRVHVLDRLVAPVERQEQRPAHRVEHRHAGAVGQLDHRARHVVELVEHRHRRRHRIGDHRTFVVLGDLRAHASARGPAAARRGAAHARSRLRPGRRRRVHDVVAGAAPRGGELAPHDLAGLRGVHAVDLVDVLGQPLERAVEARQPGLHERRERRQQGPRRTSAPSALRLRPPAPRLPGPAATTTGTTIIRLNIASSPFRVGYGEASGHTGPCAEATARTRRRPGAPHHDWSAARTQGSPTPPGSAGRSPPRAASGVASRS